MIAAGRFDRRITFLTTAPVSNGMGGEYESPYAAIGATPSMWASLEPLRGAELVSAQQVQTDARWRIVTRWRTDLLTTYAVSVPNGTATQYFAVLAILPKRMDGTMAMDCRETTAKELGL